MADCLNDQPPILNTHSPSFTAYNFPLATTTTTTTAATAGSQSSILPPSFIEPLNECLRSFKASSTYSASTQSIISEACRFAPPWFKHLLEASSDSAVLAAPTTSASRHSIRPEPKALASPTTISPSAAAKPSHSSLPRSQSSSNGLVNHRPLTPGTTSQQSAHRQSLETGSMATRRSFLPAATSSRSIALTSATDTSIPDSASNTSPEPPPDQTVIPETPSPPSTHRSAMDPTSGLPSGDIELTTINAQPTGPHRANTPSRSSSTAPFSLPEQRKLRSRKVDDALVRTVASDSLKRKSVSDLPADRVPKLHITLKFRNSQRLLSSGLISQTAQSDIQPQQSILSNVDNQQVSSTDLNSSTNIGAENPQLKAVDGESASASDSHSPRKPAKTGNNRLRPGKNLGGRKGKHPVKGNGAGGGGRDSPDPPHRRGPLTQDERVEISMLKARQHELKKFFSVVGSQQCDMLDLLATKDISKISRKPRAHKHLPQYEEVTQELKDNLEQIKEDIQARYELELEYQKKWEQQEREMLDLKYNNILSEIQKEFVTGSGGDIMLFQRAYRAAHDDTYTESGSSMDIFPHYHELPEPDAKIRGFVSNSIIDEKSFKQQQPTSYHHRELPEILNEDVVPPLLDEIDFRNEVLRKEEAKRNGQNIDALSREAARELDLIEEEFHARNMEASQGDSYSLSVLADVSEWCGRRQPEPPTIYMPPIVNDVYHRQPRGFSPHADGSSLHSRRRPLTPLAMPQQPQHHQEHFRQLNPFQSHYDGADSQPPPPSHIPSTLPPLLPQPIQQSQSHAALPSLRPASRSSVLSLLGNSYDNVSSSPQTDLQAPPRPHSSTESSIAPTHQHSHSRIISSGHGQAIAPAPPKASSRSSLSGTSSFRTRLGSSHSQGNNTSGPPSLSTGTAKFIFQTPQQPSQHQAAPSPNSAIQNSPTVPLAVSPSQSETRRAISMTFVNQTIESRKAAAAALNGTNGNALANIAAANGTAANVKGGQRILLPKM